VKRESYVRKKAERERKIREKYGTKTKGGR